MANELRGWRPRAGVNVTTVAPAQPPRTEQPVNNDIPKEPKKEEIIEPVKPKEPEKKEEAPKPVEPVTPPKEEVKEPEKPKEPEKQPEPKEETIEPPKMEKEEPEKPVAEKPNLNDAEKVEPPQRQVIEPVRKEVIEKPAPEPVNADVAKAITNVTEAGGKKHDNFTKKALPIMLAALAIGGITWLISSMNKKKKEKELANKTPEPKKEKVAQAKEPEKEVKEDQKEAAKDEEMSTISYSFQYDNASSKLSETDQKKADALNKATAAFQKEKGDRTIVVASGASKNGTEEINQKISNERTTGMVDSLTRNGASNIQITAGVGERAATLESNSKDKHAASRNDRTTVVNLGVATKADADFWEKSARQNLAEAGFNQSEIDRTISGAIQKDKVIDLKYADTKEAKNVLNQLEKENVPYRNKLKTEYGFVEKHTKEADKEALASKNSEVITNTPFQVVDNKAKVDNESSKNLDSKTKIEAENKTKVEKNNNFELNAQSKNKTETTKKELSKDNKNSENSKKETVDSKNPLKDKTKEPEKNKVDLSKQIEKTKKESENKETKKKANQR